MTPLQTQLDIKPGTEQSASSIEHSCAIDVIWLTVEGRPGGIQVSFHEHRRAGAASAVANELCVMITKMEKAWRETGARLGTNFEFLRRRL
jgi:hypothetical protein